MTEATPTEVTPPGKCFVVYVTYMSAQITTQREALVAYMARIFLHKTGMLCTLMLSQLELRVQTYLAVRTTECPGIMS